MALDTFVTVTLRFFGELNFLATHCWQLAEKRYIGRCLQVIIAAKQLRFYWCAQSVKGRCSGCVSGMRRRSSAGTSLQELRNLVVQLIRAFECPCGRSASSAFNRNDGVITCQARLLLASDSYPRSVVVHSNRPGLAPFSSPRRAALLRLRQNWPPPGMVHATIGIVDLVRPVIARAWIISTNIQYLNVASDQSDLSLSQKS